MSKQVQTIGDLVHDRSNPRKHNPRNLKVIVDSLHDVGFARSIVIDENNEILAGNGVTEAAALAGIENVVEVEADGNTIIAVRRRGLTDEQKQRMKYYDNRSGELAEWDAEQLLADLNAGVDLSSMFSDDELDDLLAGLQDEPEPVNDGGGQADKAEELRQKWQVQTGQLWQLGEHRLICGDCTDAAVVARVMQGDGFDLIVTSPPYNSGDGGYKTDYNGKTKRFYQDSTDDRTEAEWVEFCENVLTICGQFTRDENSVVAWNVMYTARCRSGYGQVLFGGRQPFTVKETICWDKGHGFPTASKGILSRNWELIFILSKGEKYNTTQGDNEPRWAKWDIARPKEQEETHKATYPIELPAKAMADFSDVGAIVYEPFNGSGTTIIACEQLGRKCRAVEISPAYVAVAIDRWATATNKTPVLLT